MEEHSVPIVPPHRWTFSPHERRRWVQEVALLSAGTVLVPASYFGWITAWRWAALGVVVATVLGAIVGWWLPAGLAWARREMSLPFMLALVALSGAVLGGWVGAGAYRLEAVLGGLPHPLLEEMPLYYGFTAAVALSTSLMTTVIGVSYTLLALLRSRTGPFVALAVLSGPLLWWTCWELSMLIVRDMPPPHHYLSYLVYWLMGA